MKVLFVASEGVPFIKTGGLADVIGSLPRELIKQGIDARVILPKYGDIPKYFKKQMIHLNHFMISLGWRNVYCGIEKLEYAGVTFYFVDNEYYFKRQGLYGFGDEAERFAFFSRAILEALPRLDFHPDIIHCHDWHTGILSVFLKSHYQRDSFYKNIRTVFTIHNLQYQGVFPSSILGNVLELGSEHFTLDGIEFYGQISFIKGGINYSDLITTVSETYAEEIKRPEYGERLDGLFRYKKKNLYGILNGIDIEFYNPASDSFISKNYTHQSIEDKIYNKESLQRNLGLPVRLDIPVLGMVSRLVSQKGIQLIAEILDDILNLDIQLIVLGTGDKNYESMFLAAAQKCPAKISTNIMFGTTLAHQIYAGSDIYLMPSAFEPCGLSQIIALRYGSIPVVRETGGLKDTIKPYNEYTGEGNGFSFTQMNGQDFLYTLKRAINLYQQKNIWTKIMASAMQCDYSWYKSAQKYQDLYNKLMFN
ncbi:glycogen synthase GlgA [Desulfotomaculum defluvii]